MVHAIFEVLRMVEEAPTYGEKVETLRRVVSQPLLYILKYTFDPNIKWLLPEGPPPPFKENKEPVGSEVMLRKEARTLYLFCSGGPEDNPNIKQRRREQKFMELLESVHPEDAKVLIAAKDRKLPYPSITEKLVRDALPGLLS